ncbi:MAG: hypothetical protein HQ542_06615 [Bacteroidia bacterium]|nr:hypothetical protein [Bacteroidia bacterium]
MKRNMIPKIIHNFIDNSDCEAVGKRTFQNLNPANGTIICEVARSGRKDVDLAVKAQLSWEVVPGC